MSVHNSFFSAFLRVVPKISSTFLFTYPDAFLSTWLKASLSPCGSLMKCSVGFGRFKIASRLMISVLASAIVG